MKRSLVTHGCESSIPTGLQERLWLSLQLRVCHHQHPASGSLARALSCPNRSLCKHTCRASISRTSSNICAGLVIGLLKAVCLLVCWFWACSLSRSVPSIVLDVNAAEAVGQPQELSLPESLSGGAADTRPRSHEEGIMAHVELSCGTREGRGEGTSDSSDRSCISSKSFGQALISWHLTVPGIEQHHVLVTQQWHQRPATRAERTTTTSLGSQAAWLSKGVF